MFVLKNQISPNRGIEGIITDRYLTVQAAADASGYNDQYIRRLLRANKLASLKVGQMWLIQMDSLEAYLHNSAAGRQAPGTKVISIT